jgi:hypothetical protein
VLELLIRRFGGDFVCMSWGKRERERGVFVGDAGLGEGLGYRGGEGSDSGGVLHVRVGLSGEEGGLTRGPQLSAASGGAARTALARR